MFKFLFCLLPCLALSKNLGKNLTCPDGAKILASGIDQSEQNTILHLHNDLRQRIMNGTVPGQPRGINLRTIKYDEKLQKIALNLTNGCKFKLGNGTDTRWSWVGLNIYIQSYSYWVPLKADWNSAFKAWADQMKYFDYDRYVYGKEKHSAFGYTQLVWDETDHLGCYYTYYYDNLRPKTPFSKLYACYYGKGGNILYRAPYEKYRYGSGATENVIE